MRTDETRADLAVTTGLLLAGIAYLVRMVTYPDNAGLVPAIVSVVMVLALGLQLLRTFVARRRARSSRGTHPADDSPTGGAYARLIALTGARRRRFLVITSWTVGYLGLIVLVGFVVAAPVAIAAVLRMSGESARTCLAGAGLALAAAVGLMALSLGTEMFTGLVFGR